MITINSNNVLENMIWVKLRERNDFLIVRETLERIGIASRNDQGENVLIQSCHILHKQGKYAIVHFKEMFILDGKNSDLSMEDIARRNTIANLLSEWKLVELVDREKSKSPIIPVSSLRIIHANDKANWKLASKYTIGRK